MPRFTLLLTIFSLFVLSCTSDNDNDNDTENRDGEEDFQFYENSTITLNDSDFASINNGDNLVFEYWFVADDNPNIADDEYSERIIFEIAPNVNSFILTDDELALANTYFDKYCFCLIEGSIAIESGTITGAKINGERWEVSIAITFTDFNEQSREISGTFILGTR